MKVVYAVDANSFSSEDHSGVVLKVHSQIRQMEKAGFEVDLQQYYWEGGFPQISVEEDTDFLYYRRIESSVNLICKFLQLKKKIKT